MTVIRLGLLGVGAACCIMTNLQTVEIVLSFCDHTKCQILISISLACHDASAS